MPNKSVKNEKTETMLNARWVLYYVALCSACVWVLCSLARLGTVPRTSGGPEAGFGGIMFLFYWLPLYMIFYMGSYIMLIYLVLRGLSRRTPNSLYAMVGLASVSVLGASVTGMWHIQMVVAIEQYEEQRALGISLWNRPNGASIRVNHKRISSEQLRYVNGVSNLHDFGGVSSDFSSADICDMEPMPEVQELVFNGCILTAENNKCLSEVFSNVQEIGLWGSEWDTAGTRWVATMPRLKRASFKNSGVGDKELSFFSDSKTIEEIDLSSLLIFSNSPVS